jgi:hypothetical protein
VERLTTSEYASHVQPGPFYVERIAATLRQSGAAMLTAAGLALLFWKAIRARQPDAVTLIVWAVVPLTVMSLGTAKLYHYAYPFLPPLAIGAGCAAALMPRAIVSCLEWVFGRSGADGREHLGVARVVIVGLLMFGALPVPAYVGNLARLTSDVHPVREARDCLRALAGRAEDTAAAGRGVWVEGDIRAWVYFHYLRTLGPWQQRPDRPSDVTVMLNLHAPESFRPVLISDARFDQLAQRLQEGDRALLELVARRSGLSEAAIDASLRASDIGVIRLTSERLLLPGPYRVCASARLATDRRAP